MHELAKNEISFIDNLSDDGIFIYRDLQKKFAKDLKDSILITNGEEYHTDYTPPIHHVSLVRSVITRLINMAEIQTIR